MRRILITGASLGIGAATAERFAEPGAIVGVHYRQSEAEAKSVAARVEERGERAVLVRGDLTQPEACRDVVEKFVEAAGGLDVLVNNAGGLVMRSEVAQMEWELLEAVFRLNVFSAFMVTRHALPHLRRGASPAIVNVGSIAARHGAPTATAYGASKAALHSFTRGLAKEEAPVIRVNCVAPGVIDTPFHEKYSSQERMEQWSQDTPLGRNGRAEDIAEAIHFLCGPSGNFITGETIDVNGGLFMR